MSARNRTIDQVRHSGRRTLNQRGKKSGAARKLEKELRATTAAVDSIPAAVNRLMATYVAGDRARRTDELAEWERLEREDEARADFVPSFASRWNGEWCRGKSSATEAPTEAESEALFAWEREHLGVDRHTGAVRKLG